MSPFQLSLVSIVQGITEFLPISSSGHLAILHLPLGWPDQGPEIDVAVHVGTLFAVIFYLRAEVRRLIVTLFTFTKGEVRGPSEADKGLLLALIIGTLPLAVFGALIVLLDWADLLRTAEVVGWMTLLFALPLYFADKYGSHEKVLENADWKNGLYMGLAQCLALVPGTSRSGVTITLARQLGFKRTDAARYSMLLSIPAILAAGSAITYGLIEEGNVELGIDALLAAALAALTAFLAIKVLMAWLERATLLPFVLYRLVLGSVILAWVYLGA